MIKTPEDILEFWFSEEVSPFWFRRSDDLDKVITTQFLETQEAAHSGKLDHWRANAQSALALTITLDQFPRNIFRGTPRSFQSDPKALQTAKYALEMGFDKEVADRQRSFFYLPFMHSEDIADQRLSAAIYEKLGNESSLDFAKQHHDIIERFGRFPYRNTVLGRESTAEEVEFLKEHSGF
jgi:uncharacterized protein (DUF924 family)